jgi:putative DNA primase/helicase
MFNDVNVQNTGVTGVTGVTAIKINELQGNTDKNTGVTGVTVDSAEKDNDPLGLLNKSKQKQGDIHFDDALDPEVTPPETITDESPSIEDRPCYRCYADYWIDHQGNEKGAGVWYHSIGKGEDAQPVDSWICGEMNIVAVARDKSGRSFGHVLQFKNRLGQWRTWNMPTRLLAGRGDDLLKELLDMGLKVNHLKRSQIAAYIASTSPKKDIWTASQVGWFDDDYTNFVLPNCTIGTSADDVLFQAESNTHQEYNHSGELRDWRSNISELCRGNPVLVFTVSCAFAGSLLKVCNIDGIGFHYFGESSRGKTTGLKLAASVWGHWEKYKRSWKATANGLEGAANLFNDGLITLDEIGDGEAKEISDALYMFGNRTGKQRADVLGQAKAVKTWRIAALSNGEKTIESHLAQKGLTMKAGQLIRFLQVPLFGQYGAFDDLHGFKDGREFSEAILKNTTKVYGVAGREWIDKLTQDTSTLLSCPAYLDDAVTGFIKQFGALTPQEARAAKAFALVGIAGELATEYGITGWRKNESIDAALANFKQWRQYRGIGETEPQQVKDALQSYIESFGDARFTCTLDDTRLHGERSGYWRDTEKGRQWLFSNAGLKQAVKGYDVKQVESILKDAGWLIPNNNGKTKQQVKFKNSEEESNWFYVIVIKDDGNTGNGNTGNTDEKTGVTTQHIDFNGGNTGNTGNTGILDNELNIDDVEVF